MKALILITLLLALAYSQYHVDGCDGTVNDQPLITDEPTLVATVENGKKYTIDYDGRKFYILVLNGTAYHMGYAYGQLMKEELPQMVEAFFGWAENYIENNVSSIITKLPKFIKKYIGEIGLEGAKQLLRLNYYICAPYIERHWNDELSGLADGSGVDIWTLREINLVPELLKASCSILGAWGKATTTGNVLHLRALDWEEHAPISRWPTIAVYHPSDKDSVPFSNIAWTGFIGSLTGHSSAQISVGERLRGSPVYDDSRFGKPWTFVLRDVLQYTTNINDALKYMNQSHRTCSIYVGLGSSQDNSFRIIEYSHKEFNVYDDNNWHFDDNHPQLENLIWKEYRSGSPCFKNILEPAHGNIDAELIFRNVTGLGQTGDSQVIVMDLANDIIYAQYPNPFTMDPSYVRPIVKVDMKKFYDPQVLNAQLSNQVFADE